MGPKNGLSRAQISLLVAETIVLTATAVLWQFAQEERLRITGKKKLSD